MITQYLIEITSINHHFLYQLIHRRIGILGTVSKKLTGKVNMIISIRQFVSALIVLSCLFVHATVHAENTRGRNAPFHVMDELLGPTQPNDPQEDLTALGFICASSYSPLEGHIEFLVKPNLEYSGCFGEHIKYFYICSTLESWGCDNYTQANLYPAHMMGHMLETIVQASLKNQFVIVNAPPSEGVVVQFFYYTEP